MIKIAMSSSIQDIRLAYVAPTHESIALMPGNLAEKLQKWVELNGIPEKWKALLKPIDLSEQIDLASLLSVNDVKEIGEKAALRLINSPCTKNTEHYWQKCARAIIGGKDMPYMAVNPPREIMCADDLETYEFAIRCADIYLWLSQRNEFSFSAPQEIIVRSNRYKWSMDVDRALIKK
jgi:hypothetical protein